MMTLWMCAIFIAMCFRIPRMLRWYYARRVEGALKNVAVQTDNATVGQLINTIETANLPRINRPEVFNHCRSIYGLVAESPTVSPELKYELRRAMMANGVVLH